ncbi:SGNH/GDSL hydrolase family protein [Nocardioides sp. JQ2195]|uniref:SGNH/GDSL hydrolase family protein n=1 Tax=Nocardioides sp. JQ2195 TaxID=2592334 RepID=UPI00143E3BDE|nr:SGNH/GDSL hydrolase family protein [Nocardioides sp. JQ2195]QIX27974.1 SGNH/GDSL hydrolase family protein [Nocardioides sp. JQ2195]
MGEFVVRGSRLRWATRVVALVAMASLLALSYAAFERATSEDVSKCERFSLASQAREAVVTGTGQRVVVIGDSYSAGLGLDDPARSWPRELNGEVHVHGFSGSGFSAHASTCGNVSYADRAARAVRDGADLVVVQGGLNDVRSSDAAIRAGVRRVLAQLQGLEVVVVGPVPAPSRMPAAAHVDKVLAREMSAAGVRYLSMIDLDLDYLDGDLHLTPQGHRELGAAVADALAG